MRARRKRVALLIETSKGYGRGVLKGICRYTQAEARWEITVDERGLETPIPPWLGSWKGDGAITRSEDLELPRAARSCGASVVHLGGSLHKDFPTVTSKEDEIASFAIEHFSDRGFTNLGFVGAQGARWSEKRLASFLQQTKEIGVEPRVLKMPPLNRLDHSWGKDRSIIDEWLKEFQPPVGILACYDVMGMRVLEACRRIGFAVPEEIAVLGVDNDEILCELASPQLSSIEQDVERIGFEAAKLLDALMEGEDVPREVSVSPSRIVPRMSTDIVAIDDPQVAQALQYIRDHACEGISVDQVAEFAALSRRALERRFQQLLGRSPGKEILKLQIDRSKELLRQSDFKLEVIAHRCGFSSASYFCRAFLKATGYSPRKWKEGWAQHDSSTKG